MIASHPTFAIQVAILSLLSVHFGHSIAEEPIRFNRDIRPILSDNCFYCHGPDRNKRQAELRLDTQTGLHGDAGVSGAVIAGDPDASQMMLRILSADPDERMPPPESGKQLTEPQIALIRRWIAEGARFEGHWAFLPRNPSSVLTPVQGKSVQDAEATARLDAMIQAGLAKQQLEASNEADKITLLRRLHFDLTGLPPSDAEVASFLGDDSPMAYDRLVDQLLESPRFGERMAMWWLDLVRYADSVGYHGDQEVSVSPFRDYVIDAFNNNKPFDSFTVEQLAGDLLPSPSREQLIASGYNRLGMMSAEGGVQDKEYLAKYMAERVRNASGTWLGITLGCAECHDHKFDPLTTKDFYRFGAFFADIKERGLYSGANDDSNWGSSIKVPTREQEIELEGLNKNIARVSELLGRGSDALAKEQLQWEESRPVWTNLVPESMVSKEGTTLQLQSDGSILASGTSPGVDTYSLTFRNLPANITAFRLELLPDDSLPQRGPGRAGNGNLVLSEFVVEDLQESGTIVGVGLQNPSATYEQTGAAEANPYGKWAVAAAIDRDEKGAGWGWAVMEQVGKPHAAVFETSSDLTISAQNSLRIALLQNHENSQHTIGRFRISTTSTPRPVTISNIATPSVEILLNIPRENRTDVQRTELATYFRSIAPSLDGPRQELAQLEKSKKELQSRMTSSLITERVEPRMVRVLTRGNWMDENGEVVAPSYPELFRRADGGDRPLTRLDLAQWIVHPSNPLTTRVLSNRLWKLFFGAGLSRKLDDLGAQGDWPSHPELLDEISQWWIDTGWDIKRWIRIVVMSKAYRQSSHVTQNARELDPYNRFLGRQSRFRLDAELVRDNALSVSGLLVTKLGGKSVRPYQPPGYWSYLNFPQREWQNSSGEELYRRGLYTHWQRQYLHPSLLVFDAPSREECTAERARSNTPLQSLVLLNDPSYVEAARAFAELILRHDGSDRDRCDYAFRRTLSRAITEDEVKVLLQLLESQRVAYSERPDSTREVLANGARPAASDLDPTELAAWTSVARTLLNLHETITRY